MNEFAPRFDRCMCTDTRVGRVAFPVTDIYLYDALAECGDYCLGEMRVYRNIVKPGMTVLDVGANIGLMSLHFSELVGSGGTVHAFEPSEFANGLLMHNCALNRRENIIVHRSAVSEAVGQTTFPSPNPEKIEKFNFGTLSLATHFIGSNGRDVPTEMISIDSLKLDRCDFIKVDVEGFEAAVIRGGLETIDRFQPHLSLEIGNPADDTSWVTALRTRGYRIFVFTAYIFAAPNFKKRSIEDMPAVVCASAIAVPPGSDQMALFGATPRREIFTESHLASINLSFSTDNRG